MANQGIFTAENVDQGLILLLFALKAIGPITARAALVIAEKPLIMYRAISKAVSLGLIEELSAVVTINSKKRKTKYYRITANGLKHIESQTNNLPKALSGCEVLSAEPWLNQSHPSLSGERLVRSLNVADAELFAMLSGFRIGLPDINRDEMNSKSFEQIINGDDIWFVGAAEIKQVVSLLTDRSKEFDSGRYTGIITSPLQSVLLYPSNKAGMSWSKWALKNEKNAYHVFVNRVTEYAHAPGEIDGAMLVDNAHVFESLFYASQQKHNHEMLGNGFKTFSVFPVRREGLINYRDYMLNGKADYEKYIIDCALESGCFHKNETGYYDVFPLRNQNDTPMALGIFIDAVKIHRILAIQTKLQFEFGILCYDWQIDYYKRVIGGQNAVYMTVE